MELSRRSNEPPEAAGRWLLSTSEGWRLRSSFNDLATGCGPPSGATASRRSPRRPDPDGVRRRKGPPPLWGTSARSAPKQSALKSAPDRSSCSPVVMGLSNVGGRSAVRERSPTLSVWPGLTRWTRSIGRGADEPHDADPEEGGDDPDLRVLGQQPVQRPDVVEVRVGQPDPAQVGRVDDGPQRGHEVVALDHRTRVDEDRFCSMQDEGIDRDEPEPRYREVRRQDIDVGCGLVGRDHGVAPWVSRLIGWVDDRDRTPSSLASAAFFSCSSVWRIASCSSRCRLVGTSRIRAHAGIHFTS